MIDRFVDASFCSLFRGGNRVVLGKGTSRGRVGPTVGVLGEVVLGRDARYKLL